MKKVLWFGIIIFLSTFTNYGQDNVSNCNLPENMDEERFFSIALSPNGEKLSVMARRGLYLYDSNTLTYLETITCFDEPLEGFALSWSSDSTLLAFYRSHTLGIEIWDVDNKSLVSQLGNPTQNITNIPFELQALSWSPNNTYLALGNIYYQLPIRVWEVEAMELVFEASEDLLLRVDLWNPFPNLFAWSPDEKFLAMAQGEVISIWDVSSWTEVNRLPIELTSPVSNGITNLAWTSDGYLAAGGYSERLRVWDTVTWQEITLDTDFTAYTLQWLPNSSLLAFAGSDTDNFLRNSLIITIIDIQTGEIIQELEVVEELNQSTDWNPFQSIAWIPDSSYLISLRSNINTSMIDLWDIETGEIIAQLVPEAD